MTYDTDPTRALSTTVTANAVGGVTVSTTGVTIEPGSYPLSITRGQTWPLYVSWQHDTAAKDTSGGTPTLVARAEDGGTALVNVTGTGGTAYMTFALGTAATSALDFVRAQYVLTYSEGGTATVLLTGPLDLGNPGLA